jgi:hypothetical protein
VFWLLWAVPGEATTGEQLINGNFESFTQGLPVGWIYNPNNAGPAVLESTVASPFTDPYPLGTHSVLLSSTATLSEPNLSQYFTGFGGNFSMSFDFRLSGPLFGREWEVLPLSTSGLVLFSLLINQSGGFTVSDGYTLNPITPLVPDTWYHVAVAGSVPTAHYTGSITPFGGSSVSWGSSAFVSQVNVFSGIIIDCYRTGQDRTPVYLDNFSIVPEPSTCVLATVGMILISPRLRKCRYLTLAF